MQLAPGASIGPYQIVAPLGAGGMGVVYRARDARLNRDVAIKMLPDELAKDPGRLARFQQEASTIGGLNHPNVLAVFDVGTHDGAPYLVCELLEGQTLRERLDSSALPVRKAMELAAQIAAGLAAAHARGIVHRDLKPDNVFVTRDGHVKILDFGLARTAVPATDGSAVSTAVPLTGEGTVLGTVGYMAPEQVRGRPADARSDIFAFGVVLHEMVTGARAFRGDSAVEVMSAILKESPPDVSMLREDAPAALDGIVRRCLEKSPDDRFQSARDLGFALQMLSSASGSVSTHGGAPAPPSGRGRRAALAALVLAGIGAGAAAGLVARSTKPAPPAAFHMVTTEPGFVTTSRFTTDGSLMVLSAAWNGADTQLFTARAAGAPLKGLGVDADVVGIARGGDMAVLLGRRYLGSWLASGTLARLPVDGGSPRPLLEDVFSADISADGESFAVVRQLGSRQQLEYPVGTVLFGTSGWIGDVRISPAGDEVAFVEHPLVPDDRGYVAVVDRQGHARRLTSVMNSAQGLAWRRDGREVWYTGSMSGELPGLYAVDRQARVRSVLQAPIALRIDDIAPGGDVLLTSIRFQIDLGVQQVGMAAGRDLSWNATTDLGPVSADGGQLVFGDFGERQGGDYAVYMRPTSGGAPVFIGPGFAVAISPDARWVAAALASKPHALVLYPTGAGEKRELDLGPLQSGNNVGWGSFTTDGQRFLFSALGPDGRLRDCLVDVASGRITEATPPDSVGGYVSPDGSRVITLLSTTRRPLMVDVPGGRTHDVPAVREGERILGWDPDGAHVFTWDSRLPARVFRVDLDRGTRDLLMEVHPAANTGLMYARMTISRDGRTVGYRVRRGLAAVFVATGLR